MNIRLLGALCIVGSFVGLADGLRLIVTAHPDIPGIRTNMDPISMLAQLVFVFGSLCAVLGILALKVTGTNPAFRLLTYLPMAGYAALTLGYLLGLAGLETQAVPIGIIGQLLAQSGMFVIAILTLATRTWSGWRKFAPLVVTLVIPLGAVLVGVTGLDGVFLVLNAAARLLLGYAVFSSSPGFVLRQSVV